MKAVSLASLPSRIMSATPLFSAYGPRPEDITSLRHSLASSSTSPAAAGSGSKRMLRKLPQLERLLVDKGRAEAGGYARVIANNATIRTLDLGAAEIRDPAERRHGYAFTNCTNCGPRFTIVRDLPYDRSRTTMSGFQMCPECMREYHQIEDRRYHAQPVSCNHCGPEYRMETEGGEIRDLEEILVTSDVGVDTTLKIIERIDASAPGSIWAVGTETRLVRRLAGRYPDRTVLPLAAVPIIIHLLNKRRFERVDLPLQELPHQRAHRVDPRRRRTRPSDRARARGARASGRHR